MPLPIQKSIANNYAAADAEIGSQVLCTANPEIDSPKLCRCRL
jgi:hypothetical protein